MSEIKTIVLNRSVADSLEEEAEELERQEMREWINKTNHETQISESVVGDKEVVATVTNADND